MKPGKSLLVLKTDYGTFAIITCVDLISDNVQYLVRNLATKQEIDVLININHNPAAWEFLIEANSIVRRHPVFASITNVVSSPSSECAKGDYGYCYGHSALLASMRTGRGNLPNSTEKLIERLPHPIVETHPHKNYPQLSLAYNKVVASAGAFDTGLLIYELNMRLKEIPRSTNAPDQGYPPVRNIDFVKF